MTKHKKPTIYDVAKLSGVSISTISYALNAPDKVNPETRQKILAAIDAIGFVPRADVRARALKRTSRIGVLSPFFTAPSFVQRFRGVASALSKEHYEMVIYPIDSLDQLQGYLSSIPLMNNIDGLIIMALLVGDQDALRLSSNGMETVLIEYSHPNLNSIVTDDYLGGKLAAEHLLKKGHKIFGFLGNIESPEQVSIQPVRLRLAGFAQTLQDAGFPLSEAYIRSTPYTTKESRQAAYELLSLPERPTAIFSASDVQALAVMKIARQLNINIPNDLALVGFDDIDLAEQADLTTISQYIDESGKLAAEILLSRIHEPNRLLQHIKLPVTLVERGTT